MKEIKWIAGNGKEVIVKHIASESNIVDHTVENKIDEIEISLGGKYMRFMGIEDNMICVAGGKIRVPEDKKEAIEMIKAHSERRAERIAKRAEIEKNYQKGYNKTKRAMGE